MIGSYSGCKSFPGGDISTPPDKLRKIQDDDPLNARGGDAPEDPATPPAPGVSTIANVPRDVLANIAEYVVGFSTPDNAIEVRNAHNNFRRVNRQFNTARDDVFFARTLYRLIADAEENTRRWEHALTVYYQDEVLNRTYAHWAALTGWENTPEVERLDIAHRLRFDNALADADRVLNAWGYFD